MAIEPCDVCRERRDGEAGGQKEEKERRMQRMLLRLLSFTLVLFVRRLLFPPWLINGCVKRSSS